MPGEEPIRDDTADASSLRLPPGQQLAAPTKWPVVGERQPRASDEPWTIAITGCVARERLWTLEELRALPQATRTIDVHCVTRWSKPAMRFTGVPLLRLLEESGPQDDAREVVFLARSDRSHSTSLTLADVRALDPLVALAAEGEPLAAEHGGPVRTVVPGRYFYKSLKWLEEVRLAPEPWLGYWEATAGYHNHADPWREERYLAPTLSRQEAAAVLARRDFRGLDLRSIDAAGHGLERLDARDALLRDANFRGANLRSANFEGANLSNAHLEGADLRSASLVRADCEGADFSGADLRGADFTAASLFGASFCGAGEAQSALFDAATRIDPAAVEQLTPAQAEYVRRHLAR